MLKDKLFKNEKGNAVIGVLVVLVVIAVAALAYLSGKMGDDKSGTTQAAATQQAGETDAQQTLIKPGNPVVAKVADEEITRLDVFNFIQTLPAETRSLPVSQLFPAALNQVINARVIEMKTEDVSLDNDPEVKKQLAEVKKNIVRNVYIQNKVEEKVTEERLKQGYEQYVASFPDVQEVRARHILVEDASTAKDLIKQLQDGADFAALAQENSTDSTAQNGGDLGYFLKRDVVPEFAEVAFSLAPGVVSAEPVKTEFGYHVILVEENRKRQPASYEEMKPILEAQLRQVALSELVQGWINDTNVERFDINGEPVAAAQ